MFQIHFCISIITIMSLYQQTHKCQCLCTAKVNLSRMKPNRLAMHYKPLNHEKPVQPDKAREKPELSKTTCISYTCHKNAQHYHIKTNNQPVIFKTRIISFTLSVVESKSIILYFHMTDEHNRTTDKARSQSYYLQKEQSIV